MEVPESLERYSAHVHVHRMVYALITKHQSKYLVLINVRPFDQSFSTGLNALHEHVYYVTVSPPFSLISGQVSSIKDVVQEALTVLSSQGANGIPDEQLKDFKKRKLIINQ